MKIILGILFYWVCKLFNFRGVYMVEGRIGGFVLMCLYFFGFIGLIVDIFINILLGWEFLYFVSLLGCMFWCFKM